jgi:pyridoxal phosphate enzyme (YggS family)
VRREQGIDGVGARLAEVRDRIADAAHAAGRPTEDITLVAVTKRVEVDRVREAADAGQRHFGENYVQEAIPKIDALASLDLRWHLIGGLQANKAARAARIFHLLHSVCSMSVAERVSREAGVSGRAMRVLLQIRLGGGEPRAGVDPSVAPSIAREICALPGVELDGVMGVAPLGEEARPHFARLRETLDELRAAGLPQAPLREMSAGMSADYRDAILEGATLVRIGSAIFGAREA